MKVIFTTILIILSSLALHSQELRGYLMREGVYSVKDSTYNENVISGNSVTIEFFRSKTKGANVIRIGHKTKIGTIFHDYVVRAAETAKNKDEYNIVVADDKFGGDIAFKYNEEDFLLLYDYDESLEKWKGFYSGMLLDKNIISFVNKEEIE